MLKRYVEMELDAILDNVPSKADSANAITTCGGTGSNKRSAASASATSARGADAGDERSRLEIRDHRPRIMPKAVAGSSKISLKSSNMVPPYEPPAYGNHAENEYEMRKRLLERAWDE